MAPSSAPRGVFAAVLTPLTRELEPDLKGFAAHARWLLANGCDGLSPLGTTGEANSLSLAQRLSVIETVAAELPAEKCIIGAGACALADAVHLTREIVRMGAAGALILPPFYYKSPGEDGLYAFFSEVIERVGDARLRLYLYHFPQLSAVPITRLLIERLKKAYGEVIAGLKDSGGDWPYSETLLKALPGFGVFSGSEQYLLNNLRAGGAGTISASVNVTAPLARAVFRSWQQPEAEVLQKTLTAARMLFQDYPLVAALKETMALITGNDEWRNILPPNTSLSKDQRAELDARIKRLPSLAPVVESLRAA